MRKTFANVVALFILIISVFALVGCENKDSGKDGEQPSNGIITPSKGEDGDNNENENKDDKDDADGEKNEIVIYKVVFDSDGGTEIASVTVKRGEKVNKPIDPYKQKTVGDYVYTYPFLGWYVGESEYDFNTEISGDLILKAKWGEGEKFATAKPIIPTD